MNTVKTKPLISVCMITYNHDGYIEKAIGGVLMQKGNFDLELIIANDASPDRTDIIIRKYLEDHPLRHIVKYFNQSENIGVGENFNFALKKCNGEYIALCEGDDFWTEPYKLQKQISFLEANPDFIACGHNRLIYNENTGTIRKQKLKWNMLKTQCAVFRNKHISNPVFEKYFVRVLNMDNFLFDYLARFGKIKNLAFFGAVYRVSEVGIYATKNDSYKYGHRFNTLDNLISLYKELDIPFEHVQISKAITLRNQAFSHLKNYKYKVAHKYLKKYLTYRMSIPMGLSGMAEVTFAIGKYFLLLIGVRNFFRKRYSLNIQ